MAPRVTSSSNRNKRKSAKPVTRGENPQRSNRQGVSTARVTSGSNGKPTGGGARVTNASQRTSNGSARVTGSTRAALPPGTRGGALAVRPPAARPAATRPPAARPGAATRNPINDMPNSRRAGVNLPKVLSRGERLGASGEPGAGRPGAPRPGGPARPPAGARIGLGGLRGGLIGAVGSMAADAIGSALGNQLGKALKPLGRAIDDRLPGVNSKDEERRIASRQPLRQMTPQERSRAVRLPQAEPRDMSARPKPPSAPTLPASVRQPSSGSSGSVSGGSTPRRSGSTPTARKASTAPTPPSERRVSVSTANRESGNYGTSKTNNPLMKDMVGRMKDREDKAQASSASKLTSNFGKDSGYQPNDKVDGSNVNTKAKMSSTTNEYNSKKRRYGG